MNRPSKAAQARNTARLVAYSKARKAKTGATVAQKVQGSVGEQELALQLRATKIDGWMPEFRFDAKRKWRIDFAFPIHLLAVEIEGGVWTQGRHSRGSGFIADCDKYNALALAGWRLLRFTPDMVKSGLALSQIEAALK